MKTAACYIRVSTDDQLEYSPDSQLKVIQDFAEKNNIILLEKYIFMEDGGKSGKSMIHRDRFLELISIAKKKPKPFDMILVWKFSRFTRNQEEAITLKSMLKRNGIEVVSISEPLPDGPFGDLIQRIVEWTDEYYLVNLSQEVRRGMKERASRGLPVCPAPIGYTNKDGQYFPNEDAVFIKKIFEDCLADVGLRTMAIKYSNLGLKTKRGSPVDNRCIEYILHNPVYCGKIRWSINGRAASTRHYNDPNIMIVQGIHEPIVSEELFNAVQQKLSRKKEMYGKYQRPESIAEYMLKGLVRCSDCGATLILVNKKAPALQCHNYAKGSCHTSHYIMMEKAVDSIIKYLKDVIIGGEIRLVTSDGSQRRDLETTDYEKLIANEKAKLTRIKAAYQSGIDTLDEYRVNKAKILETIHAFEQSANNSKTAATFNKSQYMKKLSNVLKIICDPAQSEQSKNQALRTVVNKIVLTKPENKFEVYFY